MKNRKIVVAFFLGWFASLLIKPELIFGRFRPSKG